MSSIAKNVIFSGRVQGVGFRFTAQRIAIRCELTGFVRNLPDGTVETLLQGHPEDIADCIRDLCESFAIRETNIRQLPLDTAYDSFGITF